MRLLVREAVASVEARGSDGLKSRDERGSGAGVGDLTSRRILVSCKLGSVRDEREIGPIEPGEVGLAGGTTKETILGIEADLAKERK